MKKIKIMKKYKLKKWYPSLPKDWEKGLIIEKLEKSNDYIPINEKFTRLFLKSGHVNYIEFWEPVFQFEIGKWYKSSGELFYCTGIENNDVYGYGFNSLNTWITSIWSDEQNNENFKLAKYPEVDQLLLKYAESKYSIGDKIKLEEGISSTIKSNFKWSKGYIIDKDNIARGNSAVIYENGKWADIIEKPLFKDKNDKFWYKSDFKENNIIKIISANGNNQGLYRINNIENGIIRTKGLFLNLITNKFNCNYNIPIDSIINIEIPVKEEINWFKKCEKAGKFVSKEEGPLFISDDNVPIFINRKTYKVNIYSKSPLINNYWTGDIITDKTKYFFYRENAEKYLESLKRKQLEIPMIFVQGGTFQMGSRNGESDEKPVHSVTVSDFYIGKYEVTFEEYDAFCDATNRDKPNDNDRGRCNRPVINISWNDAVAYCEWLSNETGKKYRLPTEAEWEYATIGGIKATNTKFSGSNTLKNVAWFYENSYDLGSSHSDYGTHQVGTKSPNELGIYDMSGNVYEWCSDWYGDYYSSSQTNPQGASSGSHRVLRGGSWSSDAHNCRITNRNDSNPTFSNSLIGFRMVCDVKKELPKTWKELDNVSGYWIDFDNYIQFQEQEQCVYKDSKRLYSTKEQAQASIALAQLLQLRDVYRGNWKPDWSNDDKKYVIYLYENKWRTSIMYSTSKTFAFQSEEIRDKFFENFKELFKEVKPLFI